MNDYIKRDEALKELHLNHKDVIYIDKHDTAKRIEKIQGIDLADYVPKDFHDKTCEAMAKAHQEEIADMIRVADRPQGEWITIDTEVVSIPVYWNEEQRQSDEKGAGILEKCECSVCGWRKNFTGYKKMGVNKSYNFCPNCGARMK